MATITEGPRKTYKAGADLRLKQYYIVKQDTDENTVVLASAATDVILGVLENKPNTNENASVFMRVGGSTGKVVAGGAITVGAYLTTDNAGKAVVTTTLGNEVFGRALQAADSGDIFEFSPLNDRYHAMA